MPEPRSVGGAGFAGPATGGRSLDYSELPEALCCRLLRCFGIAPTVAERVRLGRLVREAGKHPGQPYVEEARRATCTPRIQSLVAASLAAPLCPPAGGG